ncbi:MAG: hypothetical protein ACRDNW_13905 [Trebonia sp.]
MRGVTLCLLPGLTTGQRRVVIRRLRQEASRGFGPPLPSAQLTIALALAHLRAVARITRAIVRLHPVVTLVPGAFVVAVMALFVIASSGGQGSMPRARAGATETAPAAGKSLRSVIARPSPTNPVRMAAVTAGAPVSRRPGDGQRG